MKQVKRHTKRTSTRRSTHRRRRGGDVGAWFRDLGDKIKNEFTNPQSKLADFGRKVKQEFVDPNSVLRGKVLPNASRYLGWVPGVGKVLKVAQMVNQGAKMAGYGRRRHGVKGPVKRKTRR